MGSATHDSGARARVFELPIKTVDAEPVAVKEEEEEAGPLRGPRLNEAIMLALGEKGKDALLTDEAYEAELHRQPRGARRLAYAAALAVPLAATVAIATFFGGGEQAANAATMAVLALGGVAGVTAIATAFVLFKRSQRHHLDVVRKRGQLVQATRPLPGKAAEARIGDDAAEPQPLEQAGSSGFMPDSYSLARLPAKLPVNTPPGVTHLTAVRGSCSDRVAPVALPPRLAPIAVDRPLAE